MCFAINNARWVLVGQPNPCYSSVVFATVEKDDGYRYMAIAHAEEEQIALFNPGYEGDMLEEDVVGVTSVQDQGSVHVDDEIRWMTMAQFEREFRTSIRAACPFEKDGMAGRVDWQKVGRILHVLCRHLQYGESPPDGADGSATFAWWRRRIHEAIGFREPRLPEHLEPEARYFDRLQEQLGDAGLPARLAAARVWRFG